MNQTDCCERLLNGSTLQKVMTSTHPLCNCLLSMSEQEPCLRHCWFLLLWSELQGHCTFPSYPAAVSPVLSALDKCFSCILWNDWKGLGKMRHCLIPCWSCSLTSLPAQNEGGSSCMLGRFGLYWNSIDLAVSGDDHNVTLSQLLVGTLSHQSWIFCASFPMCTWSLASTSMLLYQPVEGAVWYQLGWCVLKRVYETPSISYKIGAIHQTNFSLKAIKKIYYLKKEAVKCLRNSSFVGVFFIACWFALYEDFLWVGALGLSSLIQKFTRTRHIFNSWKWLQACYWFVPIDGFGSFWQKKMDVKMGKKVEINNILFCFHASSGCVGHWLTGKWC